MEIKTGLYKHFKSDEHRYRVLGVAKHSETLEDMVVYEPLYNNEMSKLWVRPANMFFDEVEINGEKKPRFQFLSEE
jgi:hypothetical protein